MDCLIRVPATTSNVGPGFDCFGMAVSLHLEVEVRRAARLTVSAEGATVPLDRTNLLAATFLDALPAGTPEPGCSLHLRNRIPLARGLGSSATARVAGLALADIWRRKTLDVDRASIVRAADRLEGHPDNATAAVFGGFCISAGESFERVEMDDRMYLAVIPEMEIHTEAARAALPRQVSLEDAVYNLQRSAFVAARIARLRHLGGGVPFEDRLHQRHRLALDARLQRAFESVQKSVSVEAAFLSGSGPTVFVLPKSLDEATRATQAAFQGAGLGAEVLAVRVDNVGLSVHPL